MTAPGDAAGDRSPFVCVTGMHRSGTSVVARMVNLLGVHLGEEVDLLPATEDNPSGYWEHAAVIRLNERILRRVGGTWRDPPGLPEGWELREELAEDRAEALRLLDQLLRPGTAGGWKDPRGCLTLPLWHAVRPVDRVIVVVRSPAEVAASLHRRDDIALEEGNRLWLRYLSASVHGPVLPMLIPYAEVLGSPSESLRLIAEHLGMAAPDPGQLAEVERFVDPALRHHEVQESPRSGRWDGLARIAHDALGRGDRAAAADLLEVIGRSEGWHLRADVPGDASAHVEELRTAIVRAADEAERLQGLLDAQRVRADQARRRAVAMQAELRRPHMKAARRLEVMARGAVRRAHELRRMARGVRAGKGRAVPMTTRSTPAQQTALAARLREEAERPASLTGPAVAVVIVTRDGEQHLRRLLPALATSEYRPMEVVVVDNHSSDGTIAYLQSQTTDLPLTVIRNEENRSFSDANNQGVRTTEAELVLLLNNDVEPMHPWWLARMVQTAERTGAAAVGARLVYPARPALASEEWVTTQDLTLQHGGIHFVGGAMPRGVHLAKGTDPTGPAARAIQAVPAVTGACMLLRRTVLEEVGGLDPRYFYGQEDIDLALAIRAHGHEIVYDGGATLFHHEFGTQSGEKTDRRENRLRNRESLLSKWGPQLFREVLVDRLDAGGRWSRAPLSVGLLAAPGRGPGNRQAPALAEDMRRSQLRVHEVRGPRGWAMLTRKDIDVVVSMRPDLPRERVAGGPPSVAWVDDPAGWLASESFDDYDVVLVGDEATATAVAQQSVHVPVVIDSPSPDWATVRRGLLAWADRTRIAICAPLGVDEGPDPEAVVTTVRCLQRAFNAAGHPTRVYAAPDWSEESRAAADVVIHLPCEWEVVLRPSQVNVLWTGAVPAAEVHDAASYDLVCVQPGGAGVMRTARGADTVELRPADGPDGWVTHVLDALAPRLGRHHRTVTPTAEVRA